MAILSDGNEVKVRRLRFLEIEDNVPYEVGSPYTYTYQTAAGSQEIQYVLSDWDTPPVKPDKPFNPSQPDTELSAQWESYNLYQAVLLHEQQRNEQVQKYLANVARYVKNSCVPKADARRIITPEDYEKISLEALCPEVTMEDIEAELASTFQGVLGQLAGIDCSGTGKARVGKVS